MAKQYSIDRVDVSWLNIDFSEGLATGSSINETRNADTWNHKATGRGRIVYSYNPDKSGTIAFTIDTESNLHQQLKVVAKTDEVGKASVAPLVIVDNNTGEVITYSGARISTVPNVTFGTEASTSTWVFRYERVLSVPDTSNKNVV